MKMRAPRSARITNQPECCVNHPSRSMIPADRAGRAGFACGFVLKELLYTTHNECLRTTPQTTIARERRSGFLWVLAPALRGRPRHCGTSRSGDGYPVTVVGVARDGFFGAQVGVSPHIWMPLWSMNQLKLVGEMLENPGTSFLPALLRLRPGVTREQAEASVGQR